MADPEGGRSCELGVAVDNRRLSVEAGFRVVTRPVMAGLERPSTSAQAGADEGGNPRTSPGMTSRVDEPARDARPVMAGFERAIHVCPGDAEEGWTGGTGPATTSRVGTDFVPRWESQSTLRSSA